MFSLKGFVGPSIQKVMEATLSKRREHRITVRISEADLTQLQSEARRRRMTVGATLRLLILELLQKK